MSFTHQVRAQFRKLAFPESREPAKKFLSRHQREHRIAQELQLFVIARTNSRLQRLRCLEFPRLRTVCEGLIKEFRLLEVIPQQILQRRDFFHFHADVGRGSLSENFSAP